MKFTITGLVLAILLLVSPAYAQAPKKEMKDYSSIELVEQIAPQFNQDPDLIKKIIKCESGFKVMSHDGGKGVNITGIHNATFAKWLPLYEKENKETLNKDSTTDQIKMMSWAFSKGESYRKQWTTYVAYKKGGTYTFYYQLKDMMWTTKCK